MMKERFFSLLTMLMQKSVKTFGMTRVNSEIEAFLGSNGQETIKLYQTRLLPESFEVLRQLKAALWLSESDYQQLSEAYAEARFEAYRNEIANSHAGKEILYQGMQAEIAELRSK